jgi:ABC-type dipeptide/oligopeptide/nickel transport system permease subunit
VTRAARKAALARFAANRGAIAGAVLVVLVVVAALGAPLIAWHDPDHKDVVHGLTSLGAPRPPSMDFPLGTDFLGRCVASRVLYGARVSLVAALLATLMATLVGTAVGLWAGYRGGLTDALCMRLVDLILSFPFLLLVIALAAIWRDAGLGAVLLVLGGISWTQVARVVRAKALALRESEFVQGARAVGASGPRVVARHILPNVVGPVVVMATVTVAQMIIAESTLAFLGFGMQPPTATWGRMLADGTTYLTGGAPWMALAPGFAVLFTVLGFNLLGDGLRDALDPREKRA